LLKLQFKALIAAIAQGTEKGVSPIVQILAPFVGSPEEVSKVKVELKQTLAGFNKEHDSSVAVQFGSSIEVPRAALLADKIASQSDVINFGLSSLTELVYGLSKEQAENDFLGKYEELGVFTECPFHVVDKDGVGQLIDIGVELARKGNPNILVGVSGDQAADPQSITFFHSLGLNYISLNPSRIPVAKIAAAQAVLAEQKPEEEPVEEEPSAAVPEAEESQEQADTDDTRDSED
jgi:pyruvate,orthophosphate dikinase